MTIDKKDETKKIITSSLNDGLVAITAVCKSWHRGR